MCVAALGLCYCSPAFSLAVVSGDYSLSKYEGFSLWQLLLLWARVQGEQASAAVAQRLRGCGLQSPGSVAVTQGHAESSWTRDWTHGPCVDRWITTPWHQGSPSWVILSCRSSLHILDINHSSDIRFANIFSHFMVSFFTLLIVPFNAQRF